MLPPHPIPQEQGTEWIAKICSFLADHGDKPKSAARIERLIRRYAVKPAQIASRRFECPDVGRLNWADNQVFDVERWKQSGQTSGDLTTKMRFFLDRAEQIFERFYGSKAAPDHIIHVTCTGYGSPSAAQVLVDRRGWHELTDISHAYHMGCYASVPAVRSAAALVALERLGRDTPEYRVDVAHTEMCGLHFNPSENGPEPTIIHTLFADGHIKYSLVPPGRASSGYQVLALAERIVPGTSRQMTWMPESWGFRMGLGRQVPQLIAEHIKPFCRALLRDAGIDSEREWPEITFAIHPGGPSIINSIQHVLELSEAQVEQSKAVLMERGNMSSATLPHIWKRIQDQGLPAGKTVLSLAFGPGLSIFGAVFRII